MHKLHYSDPWLTVYHGDALQVLASMESASINCVVTSPPYWGLRDYGSEGQLGLEPTPEQYVENLVAVFREVRRVLRSDGTVWLNLGDSYTSGNSGQRVRNNNGGFGGSDGEMTQPATKANPGRPAYGAKPKDLVGIPWRVAFALQADGWYLRSDIIWSKLNPMPESVTDRPTKSHEYLFLLSKSARYYYDADSVREPVSDTAGARKQSEPSPRGGGAPGLRNANDSAGRNLRSVWSIATAPYPGAHFATFPPKLVEPCIKAGTSEKGVCPECGAPWVRVVERIASVPQRENYHGDGVLERHRGGAGRVGGFYPEASTSGWRPSCGHALTNDEAVFHHMRTVPATVLDPFAGSGTTGMVAQSLSRRAVLIDLSMDYLGQLMKRNRDIPLGLGETA